MFRIAFLSGAVCCGTVFAQGRWVKLAPFPEPAEELLGASANGRLYVFCGLAPGWKPIGMVYEYDPGADRWAKKNTMPLASHHVAFTEYRGKIYAFGGFVLPQSGPAAWVPIDNAWEYDPALDTWRALAPLPTKRGSPVAVTVGDRMDVIGGAWRARAAGPSAALGAAASRPPAGTGRPGAGCSPPGPGRRAPRRGPPGPRCRRCRCRARALRGVWAAAACTW